MRPTITAMLILCSGFVSGCESMKKMTRFPGQKSQANAEQLAQDAKRRESAEQQAAISPSSSLLAQQTARGRQQANFPPTQGNSESRTEALLAQAGQAERNNQNAVARGLYEQVLRVSPQNAQAHHRLGVLADQDGRYVEAQNHYLVALSLEPQNSVLLSDIGFSYYSQDRLDDAEQYLQEALRFQPGNRVARNNLAQVYSRRGEQTGSQRDLALAQQQFAMANGAEGAEDVSQTPVPDQKGIPNPFGKLLKGDKSNRKMAGKDLQAPDPDLNKPTQQFLQTLEKMKQDAIAKGEYQTSPGPANPRLPRQGPNGRAIPPDQINGELSRIESEAQARRDIALRQLNPYSSRRGQLNAGGRDDQGQIEQTGAVGEQYGSDPRSASDPAIPNINPSRSQAAGSASGFPSNPGIHAQDGRGNPYFEPGPTTAPSSGSGSPDYAEGGYAEREPAQQGYSNIPTQNDDWKQHNNSAMLRTWPDPSGSPTQYDASGDRWDGRGTMSQDRVAPGTERFGSGYESGAGDGGLPVSNSAPTTRPWQGGQRRPGQPSLIQAPQGWGGRTEQGGDSSGTTQAAYRDYDDGRLTAAQLALDSGVGDMFPGNSGESGTVNQRRQGRAPYGPRNSRPDARNAPARNSMPRDGSMENWAGGSGATGNDPATNGAVRNGPGGNWPSVDPHNQHLQRDGMTPGGMRQGGSGMTAPAEYAPRQSGFQNEGYPQGNGGSFDRSQDYQAGENWSGGSPDGMHPTMRPSRQTYRDDRMNSDSTYMPSRRTGSRSSNFGAPMMSLER